MKRLTGAFFCLLAALSLWHGFHFFREQITDITVLDAVITKVEQIQIPGSEPQYYPTVEFCYEGKPHTVRLIHNLPPDGMLPITHTADGSPFVGSVSILAAWESSSFGYGTQIVYHENPDRICFYRNYDLIQNEQLFYLYCAVVALGCGLLVLFFMCLLGRRVHLEQPFRYSLRGKPKKPRYTAPILLLLFGASALWGAIYYGAPLFHPDWVRVKALLSATHGLQGDFYAVTSRGLDRLSGWLLPSEWSVGDLVDAYYDAQNNMIHLLPLESLSGLLALILGLMGIFSLCMSLYLMDERHYLRWRFRRFEPAPLPRKGKKGQLSSPPQPVLETASLSPLSTAPEAAISSPAHPKENKPSKTPGCKKDKKKKSPKGNKPTPPKRSGPKKQSPLKKAKKKRMQNKKRKKA